MHWLCIARVLFICGVCVHRALYPFDMCGCMLYMNHVGCVVVSCMCGVLVVRVSFADCDVRVLWIVHAVYMLHVLGIREPSVEHMCIVSYFHVRCACVV